MDGKTVMALALEHPRAIAGVGVIDIAPKKAGNRMHRVIEPAPGRYVKEKAS